MSRIYRRGKTRFYFLATAPANTAAPTTAEIAAGIRLDPQVNDVRGFSFQNQPIEVPDMATAFVGKIGGPDQAEDSGFTFYDDKAASPNLRTTLAKGTTGYVLILPFGGGGGGGAPQTGDKTEVWPVEVLGTPRQYSVGNDPALWRAEMSISNAPTIDGTIA